MCMYNMCIYIYIYIHIMSARAPCPWVRPSGLRWVAERRGPRLADNNSDKDNNNNNNSNTNINTTICWLFIIICIIIIIISSSSSSRVGSERAAMGRGAAEARGEKRPPAPRRAGSAAIRI